MISKFNGTSTPKGPYRAETGDNDFHVNSSCYSLRTALCESIRYQPKSEQNVRQDPIPRVRYGEAALCTPTRMLNAWSRLDERYGSPEMVEDQLKEKLAQFPNLATKDSKFLYDLVDIASEIQVTKSDHRYS